MKVGVFIKDLRSTSPTHSSYEQSLLNAMDGLNSKHEIYILTNSKLSGFQSPFKNFKYLEVRASWFDHRIINKLLSVLWKVAFKFLRSPKLKVKVEDLYFTSPLNRVLKKYKVKLFWQAFNTEQIDIPYILTVYDCNDRVHPYLPDFGKTAKEWIDYDKERKVLIRRATYIVAATERLKMELIKFYGVLEDKIIKNPLFTPEINRVENYLYSQKLEIDALPANYIFYPARLMPQKNHVVILRAIKILKEEMNFQISFLFTGVDKGNGNYIQQKAKELNVDNQIKYLGVVSFNDLVYLYKNSLSLVFSPFNGPDNLPPLEAFSLGCPVIASKVSGAEEQMEDCALLFDPTDERQLAGHIYELYNNKELRATLIRKGSERAKKWTASDYAAKVFKEIDKFEKISIAWDNY